MIVGRVPGHVGSFRWAVHNCETGGEVVVEDAYPRCTAFARAAPQSSGDELAVRPVVDD